MKVQTSPAGTSASSPVCLLNGSLRGRKAASFRFLSMVEELLQERSISTQRVAVQARSRRDFRAETLSALLAAKTVVVAFPLFNYCLPGGLMRLLQEWAREACSSPSPTRTRVYVIVNCAYPVPDTNLEAIRVMRHFSDRLGLCWRFAVAIGGGPLAVMTAPIDLRLRRAMRTIVTDIETGDGEARQDILLRPLMPRLVMDLFRQHYDMIAEKKIVAGLREASREPAPGRES